MHHFRYYGMTTLAAIAALSVAAPHALALSEEEAMLEAAMPSVSNLERLEQAIAAEPNNLDHYFSLAMLAKRFKYYDKAAWALENMLRADRNLQRVKLELGLIYIELERFDEARELFTEVLGSNPPKEVEENVTTILAALDKRTQKHHAKLTLLTGINSDSNANSAPSSGNVTVVDTTIPLGAGAGANEDIHGYIGAALTHDYDIDVSRKRPNWRWKSSALAYQSRQDTQGQLDIGLYSVKTGPELTLSEIPLQAGLSVGYQHIVLDKHSYLRNPRAHVDLSYLLEPDLILTYNYLWEYRDYLNAPTNTSFRARTGRALQHQLGVKHVLSAKDLLAYDIMYRNENTRELYLANEQMAFNLSYTRALTEQAFFSVNGGYRVSTFLIPDTFISSSDREDDEYLVGASLGYKLSSAYYGDFIISGSYQFREVGSTIQNYAFDNHRFGLSLAKEFEY